MFKIKYLIIFGIIAFFSVILLHNVSKKVNEEDKEYLSLIFNQKTINSDTLSFDEQMSWIHASVFNLHKHLMVYQPIDYSQKREPKDLFENGGGLCYDFSRTLEKHFINNGFKTRHVAVYLRKDGFWNTILSPGIYSHSLTEVKTKNGWLIVDSNLPFYAMDVNGNIFSYHDIKNTTEEVTWKLPLEKGLQPFYANNIEIVYGLYSRHGKFYKPYNFIPDYNIRELFYNF